MKTSVVRILIYMACTLLLSQAALQASDTGSAHVQQRVITALDHLTVLEFDEPVTEVAVGSPSFQVERHSNKVFIKPLKSGVSTNLFVWTMSEHSFSYELSVGEVTAMNAQLQATTPKREPKPDANAMEQLADHVVTRTLLGFQPVQADNWKPSPNTIGVKIEGLFRSQKTVYLQYSIENLTASPYRVANPVLFRLQPERSRVNPLTLRGTQLSRSMVKQLGHTAQVPVSVAHTDIQQQDVAPHSRTHGIVALRIDSSPDDPVILRLALGASSDAIVVF